MIARRKTALAAIGAYSLFVALGLFESLVLDSELLLLLWPHLALLALHEPLGGIGETQVYGCLVGALIPIGLAGWYFGAGLSEDELATVLALGTLAAACTVAAITLISFVLALLLGWYIGV